MHPDPHDDGVPEPGAAEVAVREAAPGVHVVAVVGDVDAQSLGTVRLGVERALEAGARAVVLDLTGVVLLASAGMTLLLELTDDLRLRGAELLLAGSGRTVRRPLAVTGLDRALALHDDVPAALAAAAPPARHESPQN
ncbi:STAS domain-containing protein [Actinomycetospora endophytica]|uniref:Anti-sigma factor antagonist n=1 Tax=Actinomycetospora endophytica TaxID=2291215 RepID=A0ABS8PL54_9PSEU|nr:STAS domain-containing protein [Actinomycetospora endophytica]MCD2198215.1 STAS domain-containing protein [Actinomycetospora endophytica]